MYARRQQAVATRAPRRITAQAYRQRTLNQREEEYHVRDIHEYHNRDSLAKASEASERRVAALRRTRRMQQQNDEMRIGGMLDNNNARHKEAAILSEQDNRLAKVLFAKKQAKKAAELNARRICEQSDELKELKAKLEAAKLSQMRLKQVEIRSARLEQERNVDRQLDAMMIQQRFMQPDTKEEELAQAQALKDKARVDLEKQIAAKQYYRDLEKQRQAYEKDQVDQVVAKLRQKDAAKAAHAHAKQQKLIADTQMYIEQRRAHKLQEQQDLAAEMKKIEDHQAFQQQRYDELMAQKKAQNEKRNRLKGRATAEIERKRQEEENTRNMLEELYQEQAEQKAVEQERQIQNKREHMRQEMISANNYQKEMKIARQAELVQQERDFRDKMMAKFAEDDRVARLTKHRQREEKRRYMAEVEQMLEDRRAHYAAAVEAEKYELQQAKDEEAHRKQVIEQERQRMLAEYASHLGEHLPRGVINSDKDYEAVYGQPRNSQQQSQQQQSQRQGAGLDNNGRPTRIY